MPGTYDVMYNYDYKVTDGIRNNSHVISETKQKVWDQINIDDELLEGYKISEYKSSHVEINE